MSEFQNYVPSEDELKLAEESVAEEQGEITSLREDYRIAEDLESTVEFYGMAMCIPEGYIGEDGLRKYSASSPENYAEAREIIRNCNEKLTNIANKHNIEAVKNGNGYVKISEKLKQTMEEN